MPLALSAFQPSSLLPQPAFPTECAKPRQPRSRGVRVTLLAVSRGELLASIPLFESLTEDDLASLSKRLEEIEYNEGDVIFAQGDEGSSLFIIDDGGVEISYGDGVAKVRLAALFTGQYFGELSLFDGAPRSATAVAAKRSRLIRLDRKDLVDFVNKNPAAALRIIAEMSERLRQTNALMARQGSRHGAE